MDTSEVEIEDLEDFINGLKVSIDTLGNADPTKSVGFQAKLAKTISALRLKISDKVEKNPLFTGQFTKQELKNYLMKKLEKMRNILDSGEYPSFKKYQLVKDIAQLRAQITTL